METDRGMWKRYENISASWRLGVSRCEIWQFWSNSSMLDVLYRVYIYYTTKNLWMRISVNSEDLTHFIVVWFFNWFASYAWTWESNSRGEVSFEVHSKFWSKNVQNYYWKQVNTLPIRAASAKNTYCISQITKPHQALDTLWVLKNREEMKY